MTVRAELDMSVQSRSEIDWCGSPPAHWTCTSLKYLFKERREPSSGCFPPGAISFGEVVSKEMVNTDTLASYQDVRMGDFLINPINLNYDLKSLRVAHSRLDVRVSPAYIVLESKGIAQPRYLRWLMYLFDVAHMKTLGAGVRQTITFKDMGPCRVYLPPANEQQRIANFLDEQTARIDVLIAGKERLASVLKEWHSSELEALCCGSGKASERTSNAWITKIPKGWKLVRLKHLVRRIEQGWSPECEARLTDEGEWGVLKAGAANHGIYTGNEEHKTLPSHLTPLPSLEVKPGDVLITRASGSADLVGSFAYVYSTRPRLMLSDKNFRLVFSDNSQLHPELLAWACNTHPVREQIKQYVSGADGLAKNIGSSGLREIWLPVPPLHEQNELVTAIRALGQQYEVFQEHLKKHIDRLREYRSSLISAAVTGQIDINNFQLEAA